MIACERCVALEAEVAGLEHRLKRLVRQRDEARRWLLRISVVSGAPAAGVEERILEGARMLRPLDESETDA